MYPRETASERSSSHAEFRIADGACLWCLPVNRMTPSEPLHVFFSQVGDASFAKGGDDQCLDATDLVGNLDGLFVRFSRQDCLAFLRQPAKCSHGNLGNRMQFLRFPGRRLNSSLRHLLAFGQLVHADEDCVVPFFGPKRCPAGPGAADFEACLPGRVVRATSVLAELDAILVVLPRMPLGEGGARCGERSWLHITSVTERSNVDCVLTSKLTSPFRQA
jgi:hypothetical protein